MLRFCKPNESLHGRNLKMILWTASDMEDTYIEVVTLRLTTYVNCGVSVYCLRNKCMFSSKRLIDNSDLLSTCFTCTWIIRFCHLFLASSLYSLLSKAYHHRVIMLMCSLCLLRDNRSEPAVSWKRKVNKIRPTLRFSVFFSFPRLSLVLFIFILCVQTFIKIIITPSTALSTLTSHKNTKHVTSQKG